MEMGQLPLDITAAEILSRLPVDSIIECKLVCKTWRTLIDNGIRFLFAYNTNSTAAAASHCQLSNSAAEAEAEAEAQPFGFFTLLNNQQLRYGEKSYKVEEEEEEEEEEEAHFKLTKPLNYPPLPRYPYYIKKENNLITSWAILGSSNGLICLSACRFDDCERSSFTYNIYVYNPTTREFVEVGTETHMGDDGCRASGFGYHPSTNKYKVVRINYKTLVSLSGHVSVYTLGSGASGWRDIGEIPYVIRCVRKPGVLVNGALYWITLDDRILSFDLADEEFRIVSTPWQINEYSSTRLGVLRGCLSAATSARDEDRCTYVWIMNNNKLYMSKSNSNRTTDDDDNDDDEPSWTRLPRIEFNKPPNTYIIDHSEFNIISSYGLKYECFGRFLKFYSISELELHLNLHHLVPYTKSFVSLKALGEENVKKICNKLARQGLSQGRHASELKPRN